MNQISNAVLLECLEQLAGGQPVERILARFSEFAGELRPILESTRRLAGLSVDPPPAMQQRARAGFLAQAAARADGAATRWSGPAFRPRWLVPAVALLLLLLSVGAALVPASASAIPGDLLYGTKRAVEQWRLWVAGSPEQEAQLAASFRQERIREIAQLFGTSRNVQVSFEGTLLSMTGEQWMVEGLPVMVDSRTIIMGSPRVGVEIRVTGRIQEGELLAREIRVLVGETDAPPPTLPPTASPLAAPYAITPPCDDIDDDGDLDDCDDDLDDDDSDDDDLDDDDLDDDDLDDDDLDDDDLDDDGDDDEGDDDDELNDDEDDDDADDDEGDDDDADDD